MTKKFASLNNLLLVRLSHFNIYFRFYSCAIQYHESGSQPMGLVLCSNSSLLVIIKKETSSFVRPLDTLEHLVLHDRSASMGPELFQVPMFFLIVKS